MLATTTVTFGALLLILVAALQERRARRCEVATEGEGQILFETRELPPFARPVTTRLAAGRIDVVAPVVHARLLGGILVLDVKAEGPHGTEGFELAVTGFRAGWLDAPGYRHYEASECALLVGPQGEVTERLLGRVADEHAVALPTSARPVVQAYAVSGVTTDPADDCLRVDAVLPDGTELSLAYDYAAAQVRAQVPVDVFAAGANYAPLAVELAGA